MSIPGLCYPSPGSRNMWSVPAVWPWAGSVHLGEIFLHRGRFLESKPFPGLRYPSPGTRKIWRVPALGPRAGSVHPGEIFL
ncbi:hypothetical protein AVEN_175956-1, partial [Araneus ventricosus]